MASLCLSVAEHLTLAWSYVFMFGFSHNELSALAQDAMRDLTFVTVPTVSYQHSIPDPLLYLNAFIQEQSQL